MEHSYPWSQMTQGWHLSYICRYHSHNTAGEDGMGPRSTKPARQQSRFSSAHLQSTGSGYANTIRVCISRFARVLRRYHPHWNTFVTCFYTAWVLNKLCFANVNKLNHHYFRTYLIMQIRGADLFIHFVTSYYLIVFFVQVKHGWALMSG